MLDGTISSISNSRKKLASSKGEGNVAIGKEVRLEKVSRRDFGWEA